MIPEMALLRAFMVAARTLSFTKAAEDLGISQPRFSLLIRKLEERIGFALFIRQHRRVELSANGQALYRKTLELNAVVDEMDGLIRQLKHGSDWRLRIGGPRWTLDNRERLRVLEEFSGRHPQVEFETISRPTHTLVEDLRRGEVDVAVLTEPFEHRGLQTLTLQRSGVSIVMPLEDAHQGEEVPLAALSGRPLVTYSPKIGEAHHRAWFRHMREAGAQLVHAHEDHPTAVLRFAARHRLWAIFHTWPGVPLALDPADAMTAKPLAGASASGIELRIARRNNVGRAARAVEALWTLLCAELAHGDRSRSGERPQSSTNGPSSVNDRVAEHLPRRSVEPSASQGGPGVRIKATAHAARTCRRSIR